MNDLMGFGLVFIGYFFVCAVGVFSPLSFAILVGFLFILAGLWRLRPYHKRFVAAFYATLGTLPFGIYYTFFAFSRMGLSMFDFAAGAAYTYVEWGYYAYFALFCCFLLLAINALARELGELSLQTAALRNLVLQLTERVLFLIAQIPFFGAYAAYFAVPLLLFRLICTVLNLLLLFSCYRKIAPADEGIELLGRDKHEEEK